MDNRAGHAQVTLGDKDNLLSENQSSSIPGKVTMVMIEVQTGAYLGEDDIIGHDDVYDRT